jgi:hypothetical protein
MKSDKSTLVPSHIESSATAVAWLVGHKLTNEMILILAPNEAAALSKMRERYDD